MPFNVEALAVDLLVLAGDLFHRPLQGLFIAAQILFRDQPRIFQTDDGLDVQHSAHERRQGADPTALLYLGWIPDRKPHEAVIQIRPDSPSQARQVAVFAQQIHRFIDRLRLALTLLRSTTFPRRASSSSMRFRAAMVLLSFPDNSVER